MQVSPSGPTLVYSWDSLPRWTFFLAQSVAHRLLLEIKWLLKLADSSVRNGKPNFKMKDPQNFCTLLSFNRPLHGLAMRNTILVFTHRRKNERKSSKLLTVVRFNIIKICLCCISELSSNLFTNMGLVGWKASIACRKDDWIKSFLCFLQWGFLTILWFSDKIISIWKKVLALEPDWPRLQSHFHDFLNWHYLNS